MSRRLAIAITSALMLGAVLSCDVAAQPSQHAPQSEDFDRDGKAADLGWTLRGEIKAEVRKGRLILDGQGKVSKLVRVDLDQYPVLSVGISHADKLYNFGYIVQGEPREVFIRKHGPAEKTAVLPVRSGGTQNFTFHFISTGGHTEIDYLRFLRPAQVLGGEMPGEAWGLEPAKQPGLSDREHDWFLANGTVGFSVFKANGNLAGGWDLRTGRKVFAYSPDLYRYETVQDEKVYEAGADRVEDVTLGPAGASLQLRCTNPGLPGVTILKRYTLRAEGNILAKRVEFRADKDFRGLLYWDAATYLAPDFREGGYYRNTDYHPLKAAFIRGEWIRTETPQPQHQQIYYYNPRFDLTAASYRMKVDDHTVGSWCGFQDRNKTALVYTPAGWRSHALMDRLWIGKNPSAEIHYTIVRGGLLAFHQQYKQLPEYRSEMDINPPDWVDRVKGLSQGVRNRVADLLDEGWGTLLRWFVFNQSDYQTSGIWTQPEAGWQKNEAVTNSEDKVRKMIAGVRKSDPRTKIGQHVWYHSVRPDSEVFKAHPDWFVRDKDEAYQVDHGGKYQRHYVPEHVDWLIDRTQHIMRDYDFDYFYIDGGGFGSTRVDWPTLRVVQPYAGETRMAKALAVDGKPAWFNAALGMRAFGNAMGYFEGWLSPTRLLDWRALSVKLLESKIYQEPGTWTMPIPVKRDDEQRVANMSVLLGLQPQLGISRRNLALINMIYQLRPLSLVNVGVEPRWWAADTDLESYSLGWQDAFFITMLNHAGKGGIYNVRFNPARTTMDPLRQVYAYTMTLRPPGEFLANRLSEPEDRELYVSTGWSPIALPYLGEVETYATPDLAADREVEIGVPMAQLTAVTQVPGAIWSVNGHRRYFPFSRTRWGEVRGALSGNVMTLHARVENQAYEVAAFLPDSWERIVCEVGGLEVPHRMALPGIAVIPCPEGECKIVVRGVNAPAIDLTGATLTAPEQVVRGEQLRIEASWDKPLTAPATAYVNVSKGNMPIYTSPPLGIPAGSRRVTHSTVVPLAAIPGNFTLKMGFDARGDVLGKALRVDLEPIAMPDGWDALENMSKETKSIDKEQFGFYRIRQFLQTSKTNPTVKSQYESRGPFTIEAAMGEARVAGFAYSGTEFKNVRHLQANMAFSTPPDKNSFDAHPLAHISYSVDYHTSKGYTKRVYFNLGKVREDFTAKDGPQWGTALHDGPVETEHVARRSWVMAQGWKVGHDLMDFAPEGWDGQVILGVNLYMAAAETRLFLRLRPQSKFESGRQVLERGGNRRGWVNVDYRPLKTIARGGATAALDQETMTFSAGAETAGAYAMAGIRETHMYMVTMNIKGRGNTFIVADYLSPEGVGKRAFFILTGGGPEKLSPQLEAIEELGPIAGPVEVVDLREEVAAEPGRYMFSLGKNAPDGWFKDWGRQTMLRVGAIGPNSGVDIHFLDNETFWRF